MSQLEVKENTFYMLRIRQEKEEKITLHDDFASSIGRLKEALKTGTNPDKLELMSVNVRTQDIGSGLALGS